uniref:DNA dC->dU-editing enzyme APOBEC-3F n=1 Tax=Lonchura striata TaxID=40157 RepID=UPI001293D751|nr:DNA dC->dU-editing enzyme APOBEC-3F [Lonchura striata domestica]
MYRRKMRGMYISKRALRKHFDPRNYPRETYLLCELQWRGSHKSWQHWLRNDDSKDCHAEKYFLEEIFEPRSYNICDMTWYLSWSPCGECCDIIQDFLEEQPNVNINIRIARLYYADRASNRRGLMELANSPGVSIEIMDADDYNDCWETFIQPGVYYRFSPENFESAIRRNCSQLEDILQIQPRDFQRNYWPRQNGRVVYLLYEIRWRRGSIWRNWCLNNHEQHAEVNFLENHFNDRPQTPCSITWFLSTSPCGKCSRRILDFLRSHPNVTLVIYAAKLFRHHDIRNRQGLRNLKMNGVTIRIMNLEDYRYCWRNFVAYQAGEDDYCPQNVTVYFLLNCTELFRIFLVSRHLKKTPRAKINAKNPRKRRFE